MPDCEIARHTTPRRSGCASYSELIDGAAEEVSTLARDLDQVLGERRGVVGAAARASHDGARLHLAQQRADARHALRILLELLANDVRRLRRLANIRLDRLMRRR